ncbi:MAG: S41 family peptidase [Prevotella sp.]|nr:S41 family peptidase [Prevotella sp.]
MINLSFIIYFVSLNIACIDEEEYDDTPQGNFEALWRIIDEHYCFLDYKKEVYGLDWNDVYNKYKVRVNDRMSRAQLFEVLTGMLGELRDGHVNLSAAFDYGRDWSWFEAYPSNLSDTLLRRYLGTDYKMASGLTYRILDDNIGYLRYESFSNAFGEGNLDEALLHLMLCNGLIIDIRGNGGGDLTNAEMLAARFCNERTLVGYIQHKTGPGHSAFSAKEPRYLDPSRNVRWQKPVCVLTNRHVFSAANEFVMYMKQLPHVTIVGDHTGGGAGMPFSSSLPNGWSVRFSAVPLYDANGESCEFGIAPDVAVALNDNDFEKGEDTIIETARRLLAE